MNWNEIKERLKSPVVWTAALLQIVLIIALFNKELSEIIKVIGTGIIEILTLFAILNNPSDKKNF